MTNSTFELDLLSFHGEALEFDFETPGSSAKWLLDDANLSVKIEEDEPFNAKLRAQLVGTTVHMDGFVTGTFHYKCGRCLQWRRMDLDESVTFVLMSRPSWEERYENEDEIVLNEEDLDVSYYDGEVIDLRPLLREAVLLELPTFPVCPESESELCDEAYEKVVGDEALEELEANSIDIRWSKLQEIDLDNDGDS